MPFTYARDDIRRRVRITLADPLTVADLIASIDRQFADGTWDYGLLVDGRAIAAATQSSDVQEFLTHVRELVGTHGPRGPIAFVAKESAVIGSAQRYVLFGGSAEAFEVFWAIDDAQGWLDQQTAKSNKAETPG